MASVITISTCCRLLRQDSTIYRNVAGETQKHLLKCASPKLGRVSSNHRWLRGKRHRDLAVALSMVTTATKLNLHVLRLDVFLLFVFLLVPVHFDVVIFSSLCSWSLRCSAQSFARRHINAAIRSCARRISSHWHCNGRDRAGAILFMGSGFDIHWPQLLWSILKDSKTTQAKSTIVCLFVHFPVYYSSLNF